MDKPSAFERLPEELRQFCLAYCNSSHILNLCLTSKAIYGLCIHTLFHTIDLSTHNNTGLRTHKIYNNIEVPLDHVKAEPTEAEVSATRRQCKLLKLLNNHLEVGQQTRVLRWTMMVTDPYCVQDAFNYGTNDLWGAFASFSKLNEIDLAFMTGHVELRPPPPSLFRTATSVSLGGVTSYTVISTILSSIDASQLRHLRLNNLQTFRSRGWLLDTLDSEQIKSHRRDRHGAAQGFLEDLTERCSSLQSFHFLSTATLLDGSVSLNGRPNSTWPTEVADENSRYAEIGNFIDSVKPTLRELYFDHGPDIDYRSGSVGLGNPRLFLGPNWWAALPMDAFFDSHILPVLTSGPWPKLTTLVVRGIGHWKPINAWREESLPEEINWLHGKTAEFRQKAVMIWDAVPQGRCNVVVEDEASRPFYRFQADKTVNGFGDFNERHEGS